MISDPNCIFCKIVKGDIPCYKLMEDESFLAFLDIHPKVPGHTLVIPKDHYRWIWWLPNYNKYMDFVKKVVDQYRESHDIEFVAALMWGLDVPHAHIQLLPSAFDLSFNWPDRKELSKEEAEKEIYIFNNGLFSK